MEKLQSNRLTGKGILTQTFNPHKLKGVEIDVAMKLLLWRVTDYLTKLGLQPPGVVIKDQRTEHMHLLGDL